MLISANFNDYPPENPLSEGIPLLLSTKNLRKFAKNLDFRSSFFLLQPLQPDRSFGSEKEKLFFTDFFPIPDCQGKKIVVE